MISFRESVAVFVLIVTLAAVGASWGELPARIPTHFNASGAPDGYGPKAAILFLPGLSTFLYLLLTIVSRFPKSFNYPVKVTEENRPRLEPLALGMLGWIKAEVLGIFGWITVGTIRVALGHADGLGATFLFVGLGVVGITIAWFLRQMFLAA